MINTVLKYNELGYKCLPIASDKSPFINKSWKGGFNKGQDYKGCFGIGIICGKDSGNIECIDFDNHFKDAKDILTEFLSQAKYIYDKYPFVIEKSMSGGFHLIYKCDKVEGNLKLARRAVLDENNKWVPDVLIETRGEGGYFACDPTNGYKVIRGDIFNIPYILTDERDELITICRSFNEWIDKPVIHEYEEKDKPGEKFNDDPDSIHEVKKELTNAGWVEVKEMYWRRPKKDKGISATLGKVGKNIFTVFSSNAYPFDSGSLCKGYTPFQVIGLLKYGGDFKAFAKDLADRYDMGKKYQPKIQQPKKTTSELHDILIKSLINTDVEMNKPPVALFISDNAGTQTIRKRLLTLGNFSCVIGKSKSRKTFCTTMFTSSVINGDRGLYNKFYGNLPKDKYQILYFDTEQGDYDSANNIKRILKLTSKNKDTLGAFNLRSFGPIERCELIEYSLTVFKNVGFVVIDGIADLAKAINDEEEATRVVSLLMRWSKDYNCHILTVLHQNKNDNFATGHLGSFIMKKAEVIISVTKEKGSTKDSHVSCDYARGIDFDDFDFNIDEGLPVLSEKYSETSNVNYWND